MRLALFLLFTLFASTLSYGQIAHETFYYEGLPSDDVVAVWSTLPGTRTFIIHAGAVYGSELRSLARLRGADRIVVEVDRYPSPGESDEARAEWRRLAAQGVEFVMLAHREGMPTPQEVDALNDAGFSRCTIVVGYLPNSEESGRLERLRCKLSLTFAVRAYPKFADKEGLAAIPERIPTLYSTDYWPSYTHMDTLNLLPNHKQLRVVDSLPADDSLPYLKAIRLLDGVELSTRFDIGAADWQKLEGLALTWLSRDHIPSRESLDAFAASPRASRKLVIDSDIPWSDEERARIARSGLATEWIHSAPLSLRARAVR